MESPQRKIWLNFLSLFPNTLLSVLTIAVAFLRFYDQEDFTFLATIEQPRVWSNRLTVAALVVALVAFGVEWDRRNRETAREAESERRRSAEAARTENERVERRQREIQRDRAADEERDRAAEERERANQERNRAAEERERANRERNRATEERERAARRARIQNRGTILQIRYQLEPNEANGQALRDFLAFLQEYGE
ncbi:hypothetical protein [Dactylococcopsis salina]|uniref:Uncharacterized protein n=1 Tax=Dactylococcopsis salina (strain PCC 8305) TaxID=13035 RepID=K9YQ89_DACS8|nr:hypothetical protein [Dactylococcopsis salina]AFZ49091.1 hypothetical protein Dacsa_0287 [Dactylococcopsis salina PCC 8305]